jgi:hypothetical protein
LHDHSIFVQIRNGFAAKQAFDVGIMANSYAKVASRMVIGACRILSRESGGKNALDWPLMRRKVTRHRGAKPALEVTFVCR